MRSAASSANAACGPPATPPDTSYSPVQADEVDEVHNPGGAFVVVPSVSSFKQSKSSSCSRISLQRIGGVLMGDEAGGAVRPWPPSCAPGAINH